MPSREAMQAEQNHLDAMALINQDKTLTDRTAQYGPSTPGHQNLGLAWTGLLQNHYGITLDHPIPSHLVLLMMAASKANRAATPTPGQDDDYVDGACYFRRAHEARKESEDAESKKPECVPPELDAAPNQDGGGLI